MKSMSVKRREAVQRQAECNKLTPEQRLAKLDYYSHAAVKERAKLQKLIDKENNNG